MLIGILFVAVALVPNPVTAQSPSENSAAAQLPQNPVDGHGAHGESSDSPRWRFMQDGVVFLTFNRQARPRGGHRVRLAELVDGHGASGSGHWHPHAHRHVQS